MFEGTIDVREKEAVNQEDGQGRGGQMWGEGRRFVRKEAPRDGSSKRGAPADKSVGKAEGQRH